MDKVAKIKFQGGMNLVAPTSEAQSGFARVLYNMVPTRQGIKVAPGYKDFGGQLSPSGPAVTYPSVLALSILDDYLYAVTEMGWELSDGTMEQLIFRRNADTGWAANSNSTYIAFSNGKMGDRIHYTSGWGGGGGPKPGDLLTGSTSGATAFVQDTTYQGSDPNVSGTFDVYDVSGTFSAGETITFDSGSVTFSSFEEVTLIYEQLIDTIGGKDVLYMEVTSGTWAGGDAAGFAYISGWVGATTIATITTLLGRVYDKPIGVSNYAGVLTVDAANYSIPYNLLIAPPAPQYNVSLHPIYLYSDINPNALVYASESGLTPGMIFNQYDARIQNLASGMTPTAVSFHDERLVFGSSNGQIYLSGAGNPINWDEGIAAELRIPDRLRDIHHVKSGFLVAFGEKGTYILSGDHPDNWEISQHSDSIAVIPGSAQNLVDTLLFTNQGITSMSAADQFGDFSYTPFSEGVDPLLQAAYSDGRVVSAVDKNNSRYILFVPDPDNLRTHVFFVCFADGGYIGTGYAEYPVVVTCATNGPLDGVERIFFGATDGRVYEMDDTGIFDVSPMTYSWQSPTYDLGSPGYRKRFKNMFMTMSGSDGLTMSIQHSLNYDDVGVHDTQTVDDLLGTFGGFDIAGTEYDDIRPGRMRVPLSGIGQTIQFKVSGTLTDGEARPTFQDMEIHYQPRRQIR